jgi:hypothetical protein
LRGSLTQEIPKGLDIRFSRLTHFSYLLLDDVDLIREQRLEEESHGISDFSPSKSNPVLIVSISDEIANGSHGVRFSTAFNFLIV